MGLLARFDKAAFPLCMLALVGIYHGQEHGPRWVFNVSLSALCVAYIYATVSAFKKTVRFIKTAKPAPKHPNSDGKTFYSSSAWRRLRLKAFERYGHQCMVPGCNEAGTHVDHVYPRSKYPHLTLELDNLQIMCAGCNIAKSNDVIVDFRRQGNMGAA